METQIASAGVVTTDTTQLAVDATMFQVTVLVDAFGNVTYQINGSAPTVVAATQYQFANGPDRYAIHPSDTRCNHNCNR